jgi:DNA-binding transcriptional LysR family regulator
MNTNKHLSLLHEMSIFVEVVNTGSFSETARLLGLSPSSVSRSIKRLENGLNLCLLHRTTRKLKLTDNGKEIYNYCLEMNNAAKKAITTSQNQLTSEKGLLRIVAPKAVAFSLIQPYIPDFLKKNPDVDIQLIFDDTEQDLIEDKVDLIFRITNSPPLGLRGRSLMEIKHVLCATKTYLDKFGIPNHPRELSNHNCIYLGETPTDSKWRFSKEQKSAIVKVKGRYASNHTRARLHAVESDLGIGSLPYFTAKQSLENGTIEQVLSNWTFHTKYCGDLWLLYTPTKHLPIRLTKFVQHIANSVVAK